MTTRDPDPAPALLADLANIAKGYAEVPSLIVTLRRFGYPWEEIADAAGMERQSVGRIARKENGGERPKPDPKLTADGPNAAPAVLARLREVVAEHQGIPSLVVTLRKSGYRWEPICEAARMSRQGVMHMATQALDGELPKPLPQ